MRRRRGAGLETATLALPVRHRQPIERKPFYHVHPGRTTLTLAAPGCTFRCDFCLNAAFAQAVPGPEEVGAPLDATAIVAEAARAGLILALCFAEPTLAAEATLELGRAARGTGVAIVWKTNGFITPEAVARVAPVLAAVNIDLKAADDAVHRRLTQAPLAPVLAAIAAFREAGVWVEISTPLISGVTDDPGSVAALARTVRGFGPDVPWHLLRFHPDHRRVGPAPTPPQRLPEARAIARTESPSYVYVERVLGEAGRTTACPCCGEVVIRRHVGGLAESRLQHGHCLACDTRIAGRW